MPDHPEPQPKPRTAEELAAVRRRSLPVAIAGVTFGIAGLALLLARDIGVKSPPNIFGANLSFCAIMMGVGIMFYAKGAPGTQAARIICLAAILFGLAGPVVFARQSLLWHQRMEARETENAAAIANAAAKYAAEHGDKYPDDFQAMVAGGYLDAEHLLSPFGGVGSDFINTSKTPLDAANRPTVIADHPDYTYVGADLKAPLDKGIADKIIVVYETDPAMRANWAMGFADGSARFVTLEEGRDAVDACNKARATLKLKPLEEPESVKRAMQQSQEK